MILAGLQPRFVFSGHDHEGCYTAHEYSGSDGDSFRTFSGLTENGWRFHAPTTARQHAFTMKAVAATGITNKLEPRRPIITNDITVRSTMAEFGGNLGMFEVRRNGDAFDYAYSSCPFVNHIALWVLLVAFSICTGIIVVLRANAMINFLKEHMQSGVEARKVLQPQLFTGLRTPVMDKIQSPLPSPARSKSPMPLRRRRSVHRH